MSDFFDSLKSDLLDRRLIPVLGLLAVVLIAAIAYAVLGGSSGIAPNTASAPVAPVAKVSGIAVSEVKTADVTAGAETTSGSPQQTGGASRNPFAPMPGVKQAQAASAAATSGSSSSAATGSSTPAASSPTSSTGGSTPAPAEETKKPSTPTKPKDKQTVFHVHVLFGTVAAAATPPQSAELTPFDELKLQQPLPSAGQPLVVFRGVMAGGKSATFTLVGEAILRGPAVCLPSASQCQAIDLQPGQTEELEYLPPGADAVIYELNVVSIVSGKAKLSSAHSAFGGESKTGLELLRRSGLQGLSGLRYSTRKGVLVFAGKHAFAARAHIAVAPAHASAWGWPFKR